MSHLAPLISDLALILICAGVMTLIFKKLKQPLVLGYLVCRLLLEKKNTVTSAVPDNFRIQPFDDFHVIHLVLHLSLDFIL